MPSVTEMALYTIERYVGSQILHMSQLTVATYVRYPIYSGIRHMSQLTLPLLGWRQESLLHLLDYMVY